MNYLPRTTTSIDNVQKRTQVISQNWPLFLGSYLFRTMRTASGRLL